MKRFKKFYIEITNVCNLSCDFCPKTKRQGQFMELHTFEKILETIKPYTDYIYLHVKGEPLLHPDIDKFLEVSYKKGFKVNITTNGTLIDGVGGKLMNQLGLRQINFSLHSMEGNKTYNKKEQYVDNILSFVNDALIHSAMLISLRLWNLQEDNVLNGCNQENNRILRQIEENFNLDYGLEDKVTNGHGIKLVDRVYLNQDPVFEWPALDKEEDDGIGFCYGLRNQIAILVDGTVVPCCLDGEGIINLGNINQTEFKDILVSERALRIYDGFSKRYAVEELCRKCGYRRKFGR